MTVGDKISGFLCQWNNNRILTITSWKYGCLPKSLEALFQEAIHIFLNKIHDYRIPKVD